MKKLKKSTWGIILLSVLVCTIVVSCKTDLYPKITHTWAITPDQVTLVLKSDSTFIFTEKNKPIFGIWKLTADNQFIIFKEKEKGEKRLKIKELTDKKLTLSDNGFIEEFQLAE